MKKEYIETMLAAKLQKTIDRIPQPRSDGFDEQHYE